MRPRGWKSSNFSTKIGDKRRSSRIAASPYCRESGLTSTIVPFLSSLAVIISIRTCALFVPQKISVSQPACIIPYYFINNICTVIRLAALNWSFSASKLERMSPRLISQMCIPLTQTPMDMPAVASLHLPFSPFISVITPIIALTGPKLAIYPVCILPVWILPQTTVPTPEILQTSSMSILKGLFIASTLFGVLSFAMASYSDMWPELYHYHVSTRLA